MPLDWLGRLFGSIAAAPKAAPVILQQGAPGLPAPAAAEQLAALVVPSAGAVAAAPATLRMARGIPQLAVDMIQEWEKCHRCGPDGAIYPYLDSGGKATIGWGNTYWEDMRPVSMRDRAISRARADALFAHHIAAFARDVRTALPDDVPERDLSVFLSLAWNIGIPEFVASTAVRRYRAGDRKGALQALEWFNRVNGREDRGLKIRRRAERLVAEGLDLQTARRQAEAAFPALRRG